MPDPLHIITHFGLDIGQDVSGAGVECACEHEVMPDEDACLIHTLIELILLELTTTPQSDHVEPAEEGILLDVFVGVPVGPGE